MKRAGVDCDIGLIGHPFAPIGMGEHIRCGYRALRSVALRPRLLDIYKLEKPDQEDLREFSVVMGDAAADINIFFINGDEVEQALAHLSYHKPWTGYNVIYPAWELSKYPEVWLQHIDRFDEVWAPSRFIEDALKEACKPPVFHAPLACEVLLSSFVPRRCFGIPEGDFVFLFFFDIRSYPARKNPFAVIEAFRKLTALRPFSSVHLALKINGLNMASAEVLARLQAELDPIRSQVTLLDQVMTDNEVKNLVRNADCFVSLHRAEGFGRGMAEAMYLGLPVIATGYSGCMDFLTPDNALLVDHSLIAVEKGEYPFWEGQVWADPDVEAAVHQMVRLVDDPGYGRTLGQRARVDIRGQLGYRPVGWRYRQRLDAIASNL
jgi:glycosyltransferase involved in cell wall biosynthesis